MAAAFREQPFAQTHQFRVVVPNVRICFCTLPSLRTINEQATTVA